MSDYNYAADECPAIQEPAGLLDPLASEKYPPVATKLEFGMPASRLVPICQELAVRADVLSRYGGGGYGAGAGLELEDAGGLLVRVTAGQAVIDGLVTLAASVTEAVIDNTRSHIWLSQTHDVQVTAGTLEPPQGAQLYLGSVVCGGGAIDSIDYSGRMELTGGGVLYRRTGDASLPFDTPPAGVRFYQRSQDGLYLWDGGQYWNLAQSASPRKIVTFSPHEAAGWKLDTNYAITLTFSAHGTFNSKGYNAHLACDVAGVKIHEELNDKTTGRASWTLYIPPDAGGASAGTISLTLTATLEGWGWSGGGTGPFAGTWSDPEELGV